MEEFEKKLKNCETIEELNVIFNKHFPDGN